MLLLVEAPSTSSEEDAGAVCGRDDHIAPWSTEEGEGGGGGGDSGRDESDMTLVSWCNTK